MKAGPQKEIPGNSEDSTLIPRFDAPRPSNNSFFRASLALPPSWKAAFEAMIGPRHHWIVRVTHWVNAIALTLMIGSGLHSPIKLGYKCTKYLVRVTFLPERNGGYWSDQGYEWFAGT